VPLYRLFVADWHDAPMVSWWPSRNTLDDQALLGEATSEERHIIA
jgi:hypothetical protein